MRKNERYRYEKDDIDAVVNRNFQFFGYIDHSDCIYGVVCDIIKEDTRLRKGVIFMEKTTTTSEMISGTTDAQFFYGVVCKKEQEIEQRDEKIKDLLEEIDRLQKIKEDREDILFNIKHYISAGDNSKKTKTILVKELNNVKEELYRV